MRLPWEPITIMVTRDSYNATVEAGAPRIDESIFTHTEGDPSSSSSGADKDRLLSTYPGLESDPENVGQGSGQTFEVLNDWVD